MSLPIALLCISGTKSSQFTVFYLELDDNDIQAIVAFLAFLTLLHDEEEELNFISIVNMLMIQFTNIF